MRLFQEVHVIHKFKENFYGHVMTVLVLGYIRPELDYTSKGMHWVLHARVPLTL